MDNKLLMGLGELVIGLGHAVQLCNWLLGISLVSGLMGILGDFFFNHSLWGKG